jgi:hypothetical protein
VIQTPDADGYFSIASHTGHGYLDVLTRLHHHLRPRSYLEIGTQSGRTLAVDPQFEVSMNVVGDKPSCSLFQMTSDKFFDSYSPTTILGRTIDLAFLDGMHLYEYLLRDFINTEKHCRANSVLVLHDCIPTDSYAARRQLGDISKRDLSPNPEAWAGDVWKTIAILLRSRPDLAIYAYDAPPTGLIVITNLDPTSTILARKYDTLVREFREPSPPMKLESYLVALRLRSTHTLLSMEDIAELFWL